MMFNIQWFEKKILTSYGIYFKIVFYFEQEACT